MDKPGDSLGEYREDCVLCRNYVPHNSHRIQPSAAAIARAEDGLTFWKIGDQIYRVQPNSPLDVDGLPMARRWECSHRHWIHFREVYSWARPIPCNPGGDPK